jgi:hypothetical protein
MSDTIHIQGYKARILSRNYQTGEVTFEFDNAVPPGYTVVNIMSIHEFDKIHTPDLIAGYWGGIDFAGDINAAKKCDCGSSKTPGLERHHSTWCSAYDKWSAT